MSEGCFTCRCDGRAADLVITNGEYGRFQYDMRGRPMMIYTPHRHVQDLEDLDRGEMDDFYADITRFMENRGFYGFQIAMNFGSWRTHKQHLHFKLLGEETRIARDRDDQLRRKKTRSAPR